MRITVAVLGAGSWGTTVAHLTAHNVSTVLWARDADVAKDVDTTIYELHVRDFSASDSTVSAENRGSYLAFAENGNGTKHLKALAAAGLNTVHLLPTFDIASIEEDQDAVLEEIDALEQQSAQLAAQIRAAQERFDAANGLVADAVPPAVPLPSALRA